MRVLVLALGNPILADDGVAFHILDGVKRSVRESDDLVLEDASTGGIELLDHIMGFDRVLIIDAIKTRGGIPGESYILTEDDFKETLHVSSHHSTNFATAMAMGRQLHPDQMPGEVSILCVEVDVIDEFSEELTARVQAAVPETTLRALDILRGWGVETR